MPNKLNYLNSSLRHNFGKGVQVWGSNLTHFRPCKLEASKLATSKPDLALHPQTTREYKNDPEITGMNRDQATAHFQLLNTADSYLRSVL